MISVVDVVTGRYHDSVRLMQVTQEVSTTPGVDSALVAMATELNLELLRDMGFDRAEVPAGPDDLMIAIRAEDRGSLDAARSAIDRILGESSPSDRESVLFAPPPPHTVEEAGRRIGSNIALVSVPGRFAFVEAMSALEAGMHVMVFSDGVPIDQEIALKEEASSRGLIVMGPDCGTTIINGVGLGFANVVQPGPVGIAGASGTGIQQVCCLVDAAGVGVRHALGTGSRDLSAEVAARSILRALEALEADPAVEIIILVSKPPDPEVAETVATAIEECRTPVVTAFLGAGGVTLEGAAREAVQRLGGRWVEPPVWLPEEQQHRPGFLRGLFAGGSLQHEARTIVGGALEPISSEPGPGHWLVDFGADRYTSGRPHPMIDPEVRLHELEAVIADPETGCILLDVVLGHGAHPDPSAGLAPFVVEASEQNIGVIVSLCGTAADPQNREAQASTLSRAGAEVYLSNAAAGRRALAQVARGGR